MLEVRKSISSLRQFDDESSALFVVRAARLMEQEKRLTNNPTAEAEAVGHVINGLKPSYSLLISSWALDEARGNSDAGGPDSLAGLSRALFKFESNSKLFKRGTDRGNPSNFTINDKGPKPGTMRCFTCENAGKDANHDFKTCKHAKKWREKQLKSDDKPEKPAPKRRERENLTTQQRANESDNNSEPDEATQEDEQPARIVQVKKKKKKRSEENDE